MTQDGQGERAGDLRELIQRRYRSLPGNQRKVADILMQKSRELAFLSLADVERESGTSKATVVRLAQNLGFTGYTELRNTLRARVRKQIQMKDAFPLLEGTDPDEALTVVARQDVRNINQTIQQLDRETFHRVASMILHAPHVYTMGLGISALLAHVLAYSLSQVGIRASAFVHGYATFAEQVLAMRPSDLLIAFSFPPYSRETVEAVTLAAGRAASIVAITDRGTSPAALVSGAVIPIRSQNLLFTNSLSAISVVINALSTEVAVRNRNKARAISRNVDRILEHMGHYTPG